MTDRAALVALRHLLVSSGYAGATDPVVGDDEVRLRRTAPGSVVRRLVSLFASTHAIPYDEAVDVLSQPGLDALMGLGLLTRDADRVLGAYRIAAADGLFVVHDGPPATRSDHINGVNPAARTLASLTMRGPVSSALDLCAGSGYQSLLLARHAERVVATDILPRAVWLTALNAELNGFENIECRVGDLFEPVGDERFDLVVCNPPFIISPDVEYTFRDGGLGSDGISERVVGAVGRHLNEGGTASILVNWGLRQGEAWDRPGGRWLTDGGCDAVLLRFGVSDPLAYAALWNSQLAQRSADGYRSALDRWPSYLAELGFQSVAHVGLVLRRRSDTNWTRGFDASRGPVGDASGQLSRMFVARDSIVDVRSHRFRLIEGHHLDQRMTYTQGAYAIDDASLSLASHAGVTGEVPARLVPVLLTISDGSVTDVVTRIAGQMGIDPDALLLEASTMVRTLSERGLLELAP